MYVCADCKLLFGDRACSAGAAKGMGGYNTYKPLKVKHPPFLNVARLLFLVSEFRTHMCWLFIVCSVSACVRA
jgi:hypothetical protein